VRSGSFAVEGAGAYVVEAVGAESYAERITGEARAFRHARSPLERALNRLLLVLVALMIPLGSMLGYALWERHATVGSAVTTSVAAVVTMVPEGLILLASLTYAVAALRMARRGALSQQLNAIESLASVDVVCMDKTGTLTEARPRIVELVTADGVTEAELGAELGRYAASSSARNATLDAVADGYPAPAEHASDRRTFSSRDRWGGLTLDDGTYVLGAPELLPLGALAERAQQRADEGRRVVALAHTTEGLGSDGSLPGGLALRGLVVLAERLRPEARATVEFFRAQGIELRILSGDRPETVIAIAGDAGVRAEEVVGRIDPEGKRRVVEELRRDGRYVAMIGDGVNDVPALKAAQLAIAQGTGAQMARSVADIVLVNGDFAAVPAMVAEGRKVLRNLQRVAKLFVAKSAFAAFLILTIGLTPTAYPFLPRHLTLAGAVTIGIPGFFLALAPSGGRFAVQGFIREVGRFAAQAGIAAGLGVLSSYLWALNVLGLGVRESRTVATTTLVGVGLYLILVLEASGRRRSAAISLLCAGLATAYALVLASSFGESFFRLRGPGVGGLATALAGMALAAGGLWLVDENLLPGRAKTPSD
jgi:P-type E1-E2 ATPase